VFWKKELPVRIIDRTALAVQEVFGKCARAAGEVSSVIKRRRKFDAISLAQTFVLGFLQNPEASDEDLAQMAALLGVSVTPQAIDQRHTWPLVSFLEELFRKTVLLGVSSKKSLAPILERFTSVMLVDSTVIQLPNEMKARFTGCGGPHRSAQAALKLHVELDLRSGALQHVQVASACETDITLSRQHSRHGAGSLRIADLAYFSTAVFAELTTAHKYFLSRLQFGIGVRLPEGRKIHLLSWLREQVGTIDQTMRFNFQQPYSCRFIAWRLPAEQAACRRRKLRQQLRRKSGKKPSQERLQWCDWMILLTNVPPDKLTLREAAVLYRARWQIELLFKRWKSQDRVSLLSGSTVVRQMVRFWSRLIAAAEKSGKALRSGAQIRRPHCRCVNPTTRAPPRTQGSYASTTSNVPSKQTKKGGNLRTAERFRSLRLCLNLMRMGCRAATTLGSHRPVPSTLKG
jgi:hypothetical protein